MEAHVRPVHIRVRTGSQLTHLAEVVHQLRADQLDVRLQKKQELILKTFLLFQRLNKASNLFTVKAKVFCGLPCATFLHILTCISWDIGP